MRLVKGHTHDTTTILIMTLLVTLINLTLHMCFLFPVKYIKLFINKLLVKSVISNVTRTVSIFSISKAIISKVIISIVVHT